jgi:hypothetical protein
MISTESIRGNVVDRGITSESKSAGRHIQWKKLG